MRQWPGVRVATNSVMLRFFIPTSLQEMLTQSMIARNRFNAFQIPKLLKQLVRFGRTDNTSLKRGVNETDLVMGSTTLGH